MKDKSGFEWVNEAKTERPKWGFVATKPGSFLKIALDTTATALVSKWFIGSPLVYALGHGECAAATTKGLYHL